MAEAMEAYKEIGKSIPESKQRLRDAVAFGVFRCSAGQAVADPTQADAAIQWHAKNGEAFRETRHYYPMQELLGQVQLAKGDFDAAAKAFAPLREVDWPGYKEKGTLYQGVTLLRQQKPQDAIGLFDEVIAKKGNDAKLENARWLAAVYKAEALTQSGKPADAEKLLRESLDKAPAEMTDVQSIGRNALGDALLSEKKSPKEAMLDGYMWVLVVYNNHPDQLAKALFHLQAIFQQIGQPERAEQMASRLKNEFPTSEWTKKLAGS
jgi:tetratricopeptide (TPR) repeat protein